MKTISVIIFFFVGVIAYSQTGSDFIQDTILYLTPEDEAYMIDKEAKSLFKINPISRSIVGLPKVSNLTFAYEFKLWPSMTLTPIIEIDGKDVQKSGLLSALGVEARYYNQMRDRIREKKQANNLSGNYYSISYKKTKDFDGNGNIYLNGVDSYRFTIGSQKRFLNKGYIDLSINFGYDDIEFDNFSTGKQHGDFSVFSISTGINIGLGFGKNYNISDDAFCPIFRCQTDRNYAIKINYRRFWSASYNHDYFESGENMFALFLNANVIYETKIAKSQFTFVSDFNMDMYTTTNEFSTRLIVNQNSIDLRFQNGFRFYPFQKRQIEKGKSGNNLSGFYALVRGQYRAHDVLDKFFLQPSPNRITVPIAHSIETHLGIGFQKEFLNNFFIDIDLAFSGFNYNSDPSVYAMYEKKILLKGDIKIGVMLDTKIIKDKIVSLF